MTTGIKKIINDRQPTTGNIEPATSESVVPGLSLERIDQLAKELSVEYNNLGYYKWYCGVIKKYGIERVQRWRLQARSANHPNRVFTTYVKQAGGYRRSDNV